MEVLLCYPLVFSLDFKAEIFTEQIGYLFIWQQQRVLFLEVMFFEKFENRTPS